VTEAQGERVILLLWEILQRLEAFAAPVEEPEGCQHPEERRISLSTFNDPNHWVCGVCRFDNKAAPT
jgi:hypothetical protein